MKKLLLKSRVDISENKAVEWDQAMNSELIVYPETSAVWPNNRLYVNDVEDTNNLVDISSRQLSRTKTIDLSVVLSILLVSAVMSENLANKTPQLISKTRHFIQFRYNIPVLTTILPKNIQPYKKNLKPHWMCTLIALVKLTQKNTINILYILHTVYILSSTGTPALASNNCRFKYISLDHWRTAISILLPPVATDS